MAHVYNSQLDAFSLYHQITEDDTSSSSSALGGPVLPALGHAVSGSVGSAISNLAIYPLTLIITRLQVQRQLRKSSSIPDENEYKGVFDAANKIYSKEGGLTALYQGVLQDTGKSIVDSFLFFLFYDYLRQSRIQKSGSSSKSLPALDELAVGALAGACSKFFTTPISNIVTRKQTAAMIASRSKTSKPKEFSVSEIASQIRSEKGIQGFWSGYSAALVLTLNPSITMFLNTYLTRSLVPRSKREDPGPRLTFLLAALSKAIASSITYPLSVAKARAQTSRSPPVDPPAAGAVTEETLEVKTAEQATEAGKEATRTAARSTVFGTVFNIYRTEGLSALYEGIFGEIFKGFFSHGITMIVKEAVHKFIIQTYYLILKTLERYPSPSDLAAQANEMAGQVGERAKGAAESGKDAIDGAYVSAQERVTVTFNDVSDRVQSIGSNGTELAKSGASYATSVVSDQTRNAENVLGKGLIGAGKTLQDAGKGVQGEKE